MYSALLWATEPTTEILRRKRFTRAEVDRLEDAGFFEWQRCELFGGDLIVTSGQSPQHAYADATLAFDISRKVPLYARAGVRECWVLDLARRRLVVLTRPHGETYRPMRILTGRAEVIQVAELLPGTV